LCKRQRSKTIANCRFAIADFTARNGQVEKQIEPMPTANWQSVIGNRQ
jgi:hypothetical protein